MDNTNGGISCRRNPSLDYLKGVAAIFVVLGHCITYAEHYDTAIPLWLQWIGALVSSVHVPLFFLISGYLCHRQPYGKYLKKKLEKILLPYVVFALLKLAFNFFVSSQNAHGGNLLYNLYDYFFLGGAYWFVYCILLIFLIAPLWWRREGESLKRYNVKLIVTILALLAFNTVTADFHLISFPESVTIGGLTLETPLFQVERVLFYLPYFLAGMLIKANAGVCSRLYAKGKWLLLPAALAVTAGVGYLVVSGTVDKGFGPKLLIAVSLMLLLYALCRCISGKAGFLGVCGRYSLQIMFFDSFFHVVLFTVIARFTTVRAIFALPVAALDVLGSVLLCVLFRYIPFVCSLLGLERRQGKKPGFLRSTTSATSTKRVVGNAILYSASGILLKCFTFFLLPLYTAYLTTEDYGITSVANTFGHTMLYIVALSMYSAITRFYVDLKNDKEKLRRFYGSVTLFTMLSGLVWIGLFTIFRAAASKYIFSGASYYPVILICLVSLFFYCQSTIYDSILKSQQKAMKSSILHIVIFFVTLALNITFVVVLQWGAAGSLLATLISYAIYTAIFLIDLVPKREIKFCLDFPLLKEALKYSIPIIPHNLATKIAVLISKLLIGGTASLGSLGIYSVASQLGEIPDTLQTYVDKAYQPWLYEKLNAEETGYKKSIRNTVKMLIAVLGLLFVCIALFSQDYILLLVNHKYADAWKLVPMIVLVYAIKTIYYFYVEVLFYNKKAVKKVFIATLSSSFLNVVLSFFLIPAYGAMGSIAADAIAMVMRVAIVVWMSKLYEDIGLYIRDFVFNFLIVAGFIVIGLLPSFLFLGNRFSILNLGYKTVVVLVYFAIILFSYRKQLKPFAAMLKAKLFHKNV